MKAHLPLRRVNVSNFRRLRGSLSIPLDAPIVLIHGPNGTGKTSVLSAIELALTGSVRSLERLDDRYVAHLPFYGESYATVSIQVADVNGNTSDQRPMTVGGNQRKGSPALEHAQAQFYSERSYLDQVSLGRLLELYQHSEGSGESSLARFVNELLGLDHLDALREGLFDTTHLARFKKLSGAYSQALDRRDQLTRRLNAGTQDLTKTESEFSQAKVALRSSVDLLGVEAAFAEGPEGLEALGALLSDLERTGESRSIEETMREITELRGRLDALASRPTQGGVAEALRDLDMANSGVDQWRETYEPAVRALNETAAGLGLSMEGLTGAIDRELTRIGVLLQSHQRSTVAALTTAQRVLELETLIAQVDVEIAERGARAGSLATTLSQLRDHVTGSVCPVCDRDFAEVSSGDLLSHVARKIDEITGEGERLASLIDRRNELRNEISGARREEAEIGAQILAVSETSELEVRQASVAALGAMQSEVAPVIARGNELRQQQLNAEAAVAAHRSIDLETQTVMSLLHDLAGNLEQPGPSDAESLDETWRRLDALARMAQHDVSQRRFNVAASRKCIDVVADIGRRRQQQVGSIAELAKARQVWEQSISVADSRRSVAKQLQAVAESTRASIVERVFTNSLNRVWRDVFTRLAPMELFVPAFSVPEPSKHGLRLGIETVHRVTGEKSGRPELMLSAGNLNTAALSLFLALHLAVTPEFPCLVFDDPIQSMDEVHISQFAGLLRVLSKRHGRQIVLAVHERELFRYLALELSPAFEGDELLTIELSEDGNGGTRAIDTRLTWRSDDAVVAV